MYAVWSATTVLGLVYIHRNIPYVLYNHGRTVQYHTINYVYTPFQSRVEGYNLYCYYRTTVLSSRALLPVVVAPVVRTAVRNVWNKGQLLTNYL